MAHSNSRRSLFSIAGKRISIPFSEKARDHPGEGQRQQEEDSNETKKKKTKKKDAREEIAL